MNLKDNSTLKRAIKINDGKFKSISIPKGGLLSKNFCGWVLDGFSLASIIKK